jgi:ABC-type sugar transport system permease subunit
MAEQVESSSPAAAPTQVSLGTTYVHGVIAGLLSAGALALWFYSLDFSRGRPLYTPTLLGTALFGGADLTHPETLQPSLSVTLLFTAVHVIAFVLVGLAAARLLTSVQRRRHLGIAVLLLFVALEFGFLAFGVTFVAVALDALGWTDVVLGNLVAAATMGGYLWRTRRSLQLEAQAP